MATPIAAETPLLVYKPLKSNAAHHLLTANSTAEGTPSNIADTGEMFRTMTYGYDAANNIQRPVKVSADGQLEVNMSATIDNDQMGVAAYQDITSNTATRLHCDAAGVLDINTVSSALPSGAATSALQTSGNSTLTSLDGKITKGKDATAVGAELQQVLMYGKKPDGTLQPLETSGDRLLVDVLDLGASGKITTSTALSSVQVCGFDDTSSKFKTFNVDTAGQQYVLDQQGRFGMTSGINAQTTLSGSLHETKQVVNCGLDNPVNATKMTPMKVDDAGHLQVDVVSMSGGGDATAANQTTAIGHLSEIEGAVETLENCVNSNKIRVELEAGDLNIGNVDVVSSVLPTGAATVAAQTTAQTSLSSIATNTTGLNGCVNSNKLRVELEAGDLNIGNVDVVSASGNTQLPASLGQKANASSLSTCRSNTAGAYDLSARQTIGTASTTTKLACSSAGHLLVKTATNISNGGPTNTETIASGAQGHTEGLNADNTFVNVFLMVDTADSGLKQDTYIMVAKTNTALTDYFIHSYITFGGGPSDYAIQWIELQGTTRAYAQVRIENPPEFVSVYNPGPSANKIAVLYNYGVE